MRVKPRALFIVVYLILATVLWAIFNPGILCDDAIAQLRQAETGEITNIHPPLMSMAARGVYLTGGSTGFIIYAQCIAGLLGLRGFFLAFACKIRRRSHPDWVEEVAALAASLLLLAFTPLPFYLVTFLKDTWLCILMLWLGRAVFSIAGREKTSLPDLILTTALMLLACLTRHNAVVLLITFCPMLFILAARWRLAWPLLLVASLTGANWGMTKALHVKDLRPAFQLIMLDMMGMATLDQSILSEMPYLASNIRDPDFTAHYRFGGQGYLLTILEYNRAVWQDSDALKREYRRVVLRHPRLWLQTKVRAFHALLKLEDVQDYFMSGIWCSGRQFSQNPRYAGIRAAMENRYRAVQTWTPTRIFQFHAFWLTAGYAFLLWGICKRYDVLTLLCLLTPVLYGTSWLLITTAHDYRFLYPMTLPIQGVVTARACLAIMALLVSLYERLTGRRSYAPEPCPMGAGSGFAPRIDALGEPGSVLGRVTGCLQSTPVLVVIFVLAAGFVWWPYLFPPVPIMQTGRPVLSSVTPVVLSQGLSPASFSSLKNSVVCPGTPFCIPLASPSIVSALQDDKPETICFSANSLDDLLIGVTYKKPLAIKTMTLRLHRPPEGLRIRDLCILASEDTPSANMAAHLIRGRINPQDRYANRLTIPDIFKDGTVIVIDIDVTDKDWREYRSWGVGCLSRSQGVRRNYAPAGDNVISLREISMHTSSVVPN